MTLSRDFIIGLFVIVALAILTVVTVSLRHWDFFSRRSTYYAIFEQVKRLDVGAPVLVSGVQVGQVTDLEYIGPPKPVRVTMRIKKDVRFFSNAEVRVIPAQVIGDTTVNIDAGTPGPKSQELHSGDTIVGVESPGLEERFETLSSEMIDAIQGVSTILNDPQNQASFKKTIANTAVLTGKMNETFSIINSEIKPLVTDLKNTAANLNEFLQDAKNLTQSASGNISATGESFRKTSAEYDKAAQTLTREIQDVSKRLQSAIGKLDNTVSANQEPLGETLKQLGAASRSLNEILMQIKKGEGTLGKLIQDPRPFEQFQQILQGISSTLTGRHESIFPVEKPANGPQPSPPEPQRP